MLSVYADTDIIASEIGQPQAVSYSRPTFIAIRAGKHALSTALSHAAVLAV